MSLLILPNLLLSIPTLRVANLFIAPVVGGLVGVLSAKYFYQSHEDVDPKDHFMPGFVFSFAVAAARFSFIDREV